MQWLLKKTIAGLIAGPHQGKEPHYLGVPV
jgi:hypothetical protein